MSTLRYGSLFSGIGGFDLALDRVGMRPAWQVERNPFARRVLARHWPDVPRHEDICAVGAAELDTVDVLCGGWPCQDHSIAGKRKGITGDRSGLFYEFTRIARELRAAGKGPTWLLLENVPGLLSNDDGADFAAVIRELEDLGTLGEWRVLDSRWFGVPQRRRRVFLVCRLGVARGRARPVLFESARGAWDSPAGRKARADAAVGARAVADGAGELAFALRRDPGGIGQGHNTNFVARPLKAGGNDPQDESHETYITGPLGGGNDGIGRRSEDDPNLVFDLPQVTSVHNRSNPQPGDPSSTLAADSQLMLAHALTQSMHKRHDEDTDTLIPTLSANYGAAGPRGDGGNEGLVVGTLGAEKERGGWRCGPDEVAANQAVASHRGVRRLTPLECERLQGFPDGWTCLCGVQPYSTRACTCSDTPRYQALGNAVTVPVIQWIASRLLPHGEER